MTQEFDSTSYGHDAHHAPPNEISKENGYVDLTEFTVPSNEDPLARQVDALAKQIKDMFTRRQSQTPEEKKADSGFWRRRDDTAWDILRALDVAHIVKEYKLGAEVFIVKVPESCMASFSIAAHTIGMSLSRKPSTREEAVHLLKTASIAMSDEMEPVLHLSDVVIEKAIAGDPTDIEEQILFSMVAIQEALQARYGITDDHLIGNEDAPTISDSRERASCTWALSNFSNLCHQFSNLEHKIRSDESGMYVDFMVGASELVLRIEGLPIEYRELYEIVQQRAMKKGDPYMGRAKTVANALIAIGLSYHYKDDKGGGLKFFQLARSVNPDSKIAADLIDKELSRTKTASTSTAPVPKDPRKATTKKKKRSAHKKGDVGALQPEKLTGGEESHVREIVRTFQGCQLDAEVLERHFEIKKALAEAKDPLAAKWVESISKNPSSCWDNWEETTEFRGFFEILSQLSLLEYLAEDHASLQAQIEPLREEYLTLVDAVRYDAGFSEDADLQALRRVFRDIQV